MSIVIKSKALRGFDFGDRLNLGRANSVRVADDTLAVFFMMVGFLSRRHRAVDHARLGGESPREISLAFLAGRPPKRRLASGMSNWSTVLIAGAESSCHATGTEARTSPRRAIAQRPTGASPNLSQSETSSLEAINGKIPTWQALPLRIYSKSLQSPACGNPAAQRAGFRDPSPTTQAWRAARRYRPRTAA